MCYEMYEIFHVGILEYVYISEKDKCCVVYEY